MLLHLLSSHSQVITLLSPRPVNGDHPCSLEECEEAEENGEDNRDDEVYVQSECQHIC